ncbi:hypothetical protein NWV51_004929 [Salmonella enterica]|nr:hypothetical protein [Salmonella enterica]
MKQRESPYGRRNFLGGTIYRLKPENRSELITERFSGGVNAIPWCIFQSGEFLCPLGHGRSGATEAPQRSEDEESGTPSGVNIPAL